MGKKRHAEARATRHLLQGKVRLLTQVANGVADDLVELLLRRAGKALLAHDARDDLAELVDVERLLDVVDRVELHRGDGALEVGEAREDDDGDVGVELADAAENLDAV